MGPRMAAGLRAVLPPGTAIIPVGGVDESSILSWRMAGVNGYGLGSFLYKPGMSAAEVGAIARRLVVAIQE